MWWSALEHGYRARSTSRKKKERDRFRKEPAMTKAHLIHLASRANAADTPAFGEVAARVEGPAFRLTAVSKMAWSKRVMPAALLLLALCACKVGPNYKRPALNVPDQYRGLAPDATTQQAGGGEQFGEMKWWAVFQDETLQALIKEALANNYDLKIAATRVLQANANLGITRANQLPSVNGSFGITNERNQLYPNSPTFDTAALSLSYIVDFWGQYRRATESARATLLATQYGQQ